MERTGYLVLENGKKFKGVAFGAEGTVMGETVFTTGMIGYLETLVDKNHYGQIVVQSFPSIGNYGVISEDLGSESVSLSGYICKEWCQEPSNFRSEGDLDTFFKSRGIVGLCGIDTRSLVKTLRDEGSMNGCITTDPDSVDMEALKRFCVVEPAKAVSCTETAVYAASPEKAKVVMLDFGYRKGEIEALCARGITVTVVPYSTSAEAILAYEPDGVVLSDGPGNPLDNAASIETVKALCAKKLPIFGIGMGHLVLAAANGIPTGKLKFGHHGANLPAKCTETGRVYITAQNHGYAAECEKLDASIAKVSFINWNDGSCEGLSYTDIPAFSVQFMPETLGGPQDTSFLYERFMQMFK